MGVRLRRVRPKVDVVLVNPFARTAIDQSLGTPLTAVENPVWAGLLAGFVRAQGQSVEVVDAEAEQLAPGQTAERVAEINPTLVVIVVSGPQPWVSTEHMTGAGLACTAIRARFPEARILMLGGPVAALPERTLAEQDCDFVAYDEGFHAIVDLVAAIQRGDADWSAVRGLAYRVGGEMCRTAAAPLVGDLDHAVPDAAWDLLPMRAYRTHHWHSFGDLPRQPYAAVYTALTSRSWSPAHVVGQVDRLVNEYGVRNIRFADEVFALNARHVSAICDQLAERRYGLNILAYARVDTVDERLLDAMKRAGVNWLALRIEAASDRVRGDVDRRYKLGQVFQTVGRIRSAGINIHGSYFFGLPEDDHASMEETLNLALSLRTEFASFAVAMASPGSPLDAQAFRDRACDAYFSDPAYLVHLERRFGASAVAQVRVMRSDRIDRQDVDWPRALPVAA